MNKNPMKTKVRVLCAKDKAFLEEKEILQHQISDLEKKLQESKKEAAYWKSACEESVREQMESQHLYEEFFHQYYGKSAEEIRKFVKQQEEISNVLKFVERCLG